MKNRLSIRLHCSLLLFVLILVSACSAVSAKNKSEIEIKGQISPVKLQSFAPIRKDMVIFTQPTDQGFQFSKSGPVVSSDPYYTTKVGEVRIYRDALDSTLAYYEPEFRIGNRFGSALGQDLSDSLAKSLDGFLFRYTNFDNTSPVKWGQVQIVITTVKPDCVTLESVQKQWKNITRLKPLSLRISSSGPILSIAYPERKLFLNHLVESRSHDEGQMWLYESVKTPTPALLQNSGDDVILNRDETVDFLQIITADLDDLPAFMAQLAIESSFDAWVVKSNKKLTKVISINPQWIRPMIKQDVKPVFQPIKPQAKTVQPASVKTLAVSKPLTVSKIGTQSASRNFSKVSAKPEMPKISKPVATANKGLTVKDLRFVEVSKLRPFSPTWIGTLKPRKDLTYEWSDKTMTKSRIPISYTKKNTASYDYYYLSGSGRWGGPFLNTDPLNPLPDLPQRVDSVESWTGYWYETHYLGQRMVWISPKSFGLCWQLESGVSPSCRFMIKSGTGEQVEARVTYDLYPDLSIANLFQIRSRIEQETGEQVRLFPLAQWFDLDNILFGSGNPSIRRLYDEGRISIVNLRPSGFEEPWFRVEMDMTVGDWTEFSVFMRQGDLGRWKIGMQGMAEHNRLDIAMDGDLLRCAGAPIWLGAELSSQQPGHISLECINFGFLPYELDGIQLNLSAPDVAEKKVLMPFGDSPLLIPELGEGSSADSQFGQGSGSRVIAEMALPDDIQSLFGEATYTEMELQPLPEWTQVPQNEATLGIDPDVMFSYLRSLCYQYVGESQVIEIPVSAAEETQWAQVGEARFIARYQGFVYRMNLDIGGTNTLRARRLPMEGVFAQSADNADTIEYRVEGAYIDDRPFTLPVTTDYWMSGNIYGIRLDFGASE